MGDEEWSEALDSCMAVYPKLSNRLSQIDILHEHTTDDYKNQKPARDNSLIP